MPHIVNHDKVTPFPFKNNAIPIKPTNKPQPTDDAIVIIILGSIKMKPI